MPVLREFTIQLEDKPGVFAKTCNALAVQNVNILAVQASCAENGKCPVRFVVDNPAKAKSALETMHADFKETEVAQVNLAHRVGQLAHAVSRLAEQGININYCYCGIEPSTNASFLIFGVRDASQAAKILEGTAAAAAKP